MGINRGNCWIGAVHRSSQGVGARTRFQYPRRPKKPKPTPDTHHREVPVHVTRQVARSVDAEAPPSNRRPAITPPPGGNGGDKRPGSGDRDHPYGNGSGGDKNGEGGDGNGSGSVELSVSGLERRGIGEKFTFCCQCGFGPWDAEVVGYCPNVDCKHMPCGGCQIQFA